MHALKFADFMLFLSTLSLRRATQGLQVRACQSEISIHALLAESDQKWPKHQTQTQNFYPRSPCGERRCSARCRYWVLSISIHALLAESDRTGGQSCNSTLVHFYPRSPCGERPIILTALLIPLTFLSTLSLRRATANGGVLSNSFIISIHALLAESDVLRKVPLLGIKYFYPRSPCGERRPETHQLLAGSHYFYPRSPCGERLTTVLH